MFTQLKAINLKTSLHNSYKNNIHITCIHQVPIILISFASVNYLQMTTEELTLNADQYTSQLNTLRLRQDGRHLADDIFTCIFLNVEIWISIDILLNFVPKGQINNIPALVQIMARQQSGNKPLSEPMTVCLLTCIYAPLGLNELKWKVCIYITKMHQSHVTLLNTNPS